MDIIMQNPLTGSKAQPAILIFDDKGKEKPGGMRRNKVAEIEEARVKG